MQVRRLGLQELGTSRYASTRQRHEAQGASNTWRPHRPSFGTSSTIVGSATMPDTAPRCRDAAASPTCPNLMIWASSFLSLLSGGSEQPRAEGTGKSQKRGCWSRVFVGAAPAGTIRCVGRARSGVATGGGRWRVLKLWSPLAFFRGRSLVGHTAVMIGSMLMFTASLATWTIYARCTTIQSAIFIFNMHALVERFSKLLLETALQKHFHLNVRYRLRSPRVTDAAHAAR